MKTLYFLGPKGTYCEIAAKKIVNALNLEVDLVPVMTISKIVALVNKESACAVLPIENSIEGIVRPLIDSLLNNDVLINLQTEIEIRHCFFAKGEKKQIKHILSHPQALAQCSNYILNNFDNDVELIETSSTAIAPLKIISKDETYGAIASCSAGIAQGLTLLDENIGDNKDNKTRFVLISKKDLNIGQKSRTSIVFNTKNRPGALLEILSIFKKYNLNLIYLESRPSKKVFGEYNFFADIDKGYEEAEPALKEIQLACDFYKFLGSYSLL